MSKQTLSEELAWRGFINQTTYEDPAIIDGEPITFYWGVDPSADSMTIGNFAVAMMVRHFINHGHKAVLLVGGATGMIGDPDGKAEERNLKTLEEISKNKAGIAAQYERIFAGKPFEIVDNYTWFKDINYIDFLRDIGKHMPLSQMLGREFVQARLGEEGSGISYAEFSYSLIQGYDFLHLFREKGVSLQVCGSDQWGNSIAGVELIRRITGGQAHVWTAPLVVNRSTGKKFGKSEEGAVWLDASKTSPYKFYQFWYNLDDEGVEDYLKIYTLLSRDEINDVLRDFNANRSMRLAQKTLAYEVTKLVHGVERADSVKRVSEVLFGNADYSTLESADFDTLKMELPVTEVSTTTPVADVVVMTGVAGSKSEARRLLEQGAIYINGRQINQDTQLSDDMLLAANALIMRKGKNTNVIVRLTA